MTDQISTGTSRLQAVGAPFLRTTARPVRLPPHSANTAKQEGGTGTGGIASERGSGPRASWLPTPTSSKRKNISPFCTYPPHDELHLKR